MRLTRSWRTALLIVLTTPGFAAAQDAALSGTVTDTTGLVLPGVTVEARSAAGDAARTAVTDGAGAYLIAAPPGVYEVTFSLPGFGPVVRDGVEVRAGATVTLDIALAVQLEERVVVVGSRAQPRSVTASQVPIDAVPFQDVMSQGATTLDYQLRTLIPSFNVATHPISDAATLVRPATLRNLAHDHTLVLVNGKRRHRSSVVAWFAGTTDGSQGPDISTIPAIALRQVEVLRDGASAQYGSDAIAGVINFLLRDDAAGGSVDVSTGTYRAGDGDAYNVASNVGLPLGANGFANLSLEYGQADPTDRSVQRADAAALVAAGNTAVADPAQIWGNPTIEDDLKLFGNFGHLYANGLQFYGHANYADKKVTEGFYFRNPNTRQNIYTLDGGQTLLIGDVLRAKGMGSANCPTVSVTGNVPDQEALARVFADDNCFSFQEIAPGGFTPQFGGVVTDMSALAGLRRVAANGLTWDVSASYGSHESDFFFKNTVNASLGPDTPRDFDPGLYRQEDVSLNVDISYAVSEVVHLAAGAEWRDESFTVGAGDRASWEVGPYAAQGFVPASNGFPGFADYTAGTWSRRNVAVYGDAELRGRDDRWSVGGAVRVERFDLFGATANGKLSARIGLSDAVSLRGGVSTGFRAPTPGQQNTINVQTFLNDQLELTDSGTVPSTFAAARRHGGVPLRPETSRNVTAGLVVDSGPFTLTADYFRVAIADRLALSGVISTDAEDRALLLADGITAAESLTLFRFFINDFSTRTQGIDVVSTWTPPALSGDTVLSFTMNYTDTKMTEESDLLAPGDVLALERGVPRTRWNAAVNQRVGRIGLLGRLSYYGGWVDLFDARFVSGADAPVLNGRPIVDLEISVPLSEDVTLAFGGQNVFDTFSDRNDVLADALGVPFSQFTPWGFSGGYYYVRTNYRWGR
ncbi:MAG: TonB-dependent receptor [Acidobacteria bacterium]|nr:TonB-dependent receptor [Acidobacteriota bacterium]MYJ05031.1 TonB-dependent receptor [Acidobacteriota bacterium]